MENNKEWAHFVGTRYTPRSFIEEAKLYDVSRNIPASQLKGMNYGDIVNLLQWNGEEASLFAQFTVSRVLIRDPEVSAKVSERLIEEGRARHDDSNSGGGGGGSSVVRECGSYDVSGRVIVDDEAVTVGELVSMAEEFAGELGRKVKFMVGGYISNELKESIQLGNAGPKFSRGFIRYSTGATFSDVEQEREILSVNNYHGSSDE